MEQIFMKGNLDTFLTKDIKITLRIRLLTTF
jgi:hypothetical protein